MVRKFALSVCFLGLFCSQSQAFELSESQFNTAANLLFPKEIKGVMVKEPKFEFKENAAAMCATAFPKYLPKGVYFCGTFTPTWDQATSSLRASNISLNELKMEGSIASLDGAAMMGMNNLVLPVLQNVQIYKAEGFMASKVSEVKVSKGKIDLKF